MENDFNQDLQIDLQNLEVEATMQPERFMKWAEKGVKARGRVEDTKFRLEIVIAELAADYRNNPEEHGLKKVTEGAINEKVKLSPEYREAYEEWMKAKEEADLLKSGVDAMEQKKRMIEVLITLHGQEYFAGPSVPRSLTDAWSNVNEARNKGVEKKTKMRKRRKKSGDDE